MDSSEDKKFKQALVLGFFAGFIAVAIGVFAYLKFTHDNNPNDINNNSNIVEKNN